ncbi:MAG: DNA polymerase [Ilumatobacteraceae bacterium]
MDDHPAIAWLDGTRPGADLAIATDGSTGIGLARPGDRLLLVVPPVEASSLVARIEALCGPRWIWWDRRTSASLAACGVHLARSWDVTVVQQLLDGGPRPSAVATWATLHELPLTELPRAGQLDLSAANSSPPGTPSGEGSNEPLVRADGHIDPDRVDDPAHLADWAALALRAADLQRSEIARRPTPARMRSTAHAESACELLCAELGVVGLPFNESVARRIVTDRVGPRPVDHRDEELTRRRRDERVLDLVGPSPRFDLRNPADVRALLRWVGLDLPDTRMWRLEEHREHHAVVAALVEWRVAERIASTFGHRWLDEHVSGGRLRGTWASSDGAAGRMTATAGLHNLPAELRPAVAADPGHRFIRADLGQIEPRVLAAVSGDRDLIAATGADDLYLPIAERLGVDRPPAKLAVLGAMYGAVSGNSGAALRALHESFPTAIGHLERAAAIGREGGSLATIGGRPIHLLATGDPDRDAAQGRFARNAVVQGAAAEFFKVWAAIVRSRCRDARIVLCLHDELILHVADTEVDRVLAQVHGALDEAGHRWSPHAGVRFVADVDVTDRWS